MTDLDTLARIAQAAEEQSRGPWNAIVETDPRDGSKTIHGIVGPTYMDDWGNGPHERRQTIVETDGGYYDPKHDTALHIAANSPDVTLSLIARIRQLEAALVEACSLADEMGGARDGEDLSANYERIAELRGLVKS